MLDKWINKKKGIYLTDAVEKMLGKTKCAL